MEISPKMARRCRPHKCKKCKKRIDNRDLCVERSDGRKFRWCKHCGGIEYLSEEIAQAA